LRASSSVAGYGVHSSKIIAMSASRSRCTCMERSGVNITGSPLCGERKLTPSSVILRSVARLNTWKPPESVRIGRSQCMKRCKPPWARMTSMPGRSIRWNVLPRTICAPLSVSSSGVIAFTVPYVPTGMNAGVSTSPRANDMRPRRARPSVFISWNFMRAPGTSRPRS
jgi:hypothetical protein